MAKWNKDRFMYTSKSNCQAHISNIIFDLVKFTEKTADVIQWGKGDDHGTMRFKCKTDDYGILPLFEITTSGKINFLLNHLRSKIRNREIIDQDQPHTPEEVDGGGKVVTGPPSLTRFESARIMGARALQRGQSGCSSDPSQRCNSDSTRRRSLKCMCQASP